MAGARMVCRFASALLLVGALVAVGSPALAVTCAAPVINGGIDSGQADRIDSDRDALLRFEACLAEQQELESAFNSEAADRTAMRREAAANLRRTLDAWQRTRRAADATPSARRS